MGGPASYQEHVGAALFVASVKKMVNVLFTTMTQPPKCPIAAEVAFDSQRPTTSQVDNPNMDILVRAFLCARENLHSAMKKVTVLPQHLVTAAQWYLEAVEFQGQGLTHVHRLDCYGGESWPMRDIGDMIWAHYPSHDEEDFYIASACSHTACCDFYTTYLVKSGALPVGFFTALYGTSLRTLVDTHMRHRHTDYCGGVNGGHCRCFYILRSPLFVKLPASHA